MPDPDQGHDRDGLAGVASGTGRLIGVLVTFRRPRELSDVLRRLAEQERRVDHLIVVDNDPSSGADAVLRDRPSGIGTVDYLPMPENLGFAGGVAEGMEHALGVAGDEDWIVVLDDDDPPPSPMTLSDLEQFAAHMVARDPHTAAVGLTGGRFDWRLGRTRRVPDHELRGPVPVDYVAGGNISMYRVGVIREAGTFWAPLFYGLSEIEYGLRLRREGYAIYAHGDLWLRGRKNTGRLNVKRRPKLRLSGRRVWRRYYGLRNTLFLLRLHGHRWTAVRVMMVQGFGKPLANVVIDPRLAMKYLRLNWMACRDAWTGRMGRVVEPDSTSRKADRIRGGTP